MSTNRTSAKPTRASRTFSVSEYGWIWIATILLFIVSAVIAPGSMAPRAVSTMLPFAAILAIVSVGQTLVIQQRGIDLSAVGTIALAGMVVATFAGTLGLPVAIAGALLVGPVVGAVNGYLVTKVNVTPIVATLATNALLIGLVRQISGGAPISAPPDLRTFSVQTFLALPYSLWFSILVIVVFAVISSRSVLGRRFVAVGVSPEASRSAGIVAERYQIGAYIIGGLCFAIAGVISAGYLGNASHDAGNDYLLPSIAAVVVGGTSFNGGRGSVIASAVASLFMTQLDQLVLSLGASSASQLLVQAGAIVLATVIRQLPGLLGRADLRLRQVNK